MLRVERKPWDNFTQACKTEETRLRYVEALRLFMIHYNIGPELQKLSVKASEEIMKSSCEEILQQPTEQVQDMIIEYIDFMKKAKKSPETINQRYSGIKKFLKKNHFVLDWDDIDDYKPDSKKNHDDLAYSREQIEKMLEYCSEPRMKCIIKMFSSMGIRVGAFETIQRKHMKPIKTAKGKIYEFTIYPGENEQYTTFCTPECCKAIDEYLDYRERAGEVLTENSYLIRKQFDRNDLQQVKNQCEPVKTTTISNLVHNILVKAGIRVVKEGAKRGYRHDTQLDHGFRKWFISQCVNADINTEKRWHLVGQSLPKNDSNYVRVKQELLNEYIKAIDFLTIDKSFILEKKVEELTEEKNEVTLMELRHKNDMNLVLEQLAELQAEVRRKTKEEREYLIAELRDLITPPNYTQDNKIVEDRIKELEEAGDTNPDYQELWYGRKKTPRSPESQILRKD